MFFSKPTAQIYENWNNGALKREFPFELGDFSERITNSRL
jgi:hypothetical protein